jgi:parallel beta-helix repeat protein
VAVISLSLWPLSSAADSASAESDTGGAQSGATIWRPHLHITPKASDERAVGRIDLMYPFRQTSDGMWFADVRAGFDDNDSIEGNFGIGHRRIIRRDEEAGGDYIRGFYGYFDSLQSSNDNWFGQATLGAEFLKTDFELRGNVYVPDGNSHVIGHNTFGSVSLSGTSVMQHSLSYEARERALPGIDGEIGWAFDVGEKDRLWAHVGAFYFDHSDTPEIAGPRGRVSYEWNDALGMPGSSLAFGVEVQHDDVRDTDVFGFLTLSIPLGARGAQTGPALSWRSIESRMTRPVVRDIDIITQADDINKTPGESGGPVLVSDVEGPLVDSATGEEVDVYFVDGDGSAGSTGTYEDPMTVAQAESASGPSDVFFLLADAGDIDVSGATGGTLTLKPYQRVLGFGDAAERSVLLPQGAVLTAFSGAGRATLSRAAGATVVSMNWNTLLDGIAVSGGNVGIYASNADNPVINDVHVHDTASYGVYITNPSGAATVTNCVIENTAQAGVGISGGAGGAFAAIIRDNTFSNNVDGIYVGASSSTTVDAVISGNDIENSLGQGIYFYASSGAALSAEVTGNCIASSSDEGLMAVVYTGAHFDAVVSANIITGSGDDNIYLYGNASYLDFLIDGNMLADSTDDAGIRLYSYGPGGACDGMITGNAVTGNYDQGAYAITHSDSFNLDVRDNVFDSNLSGGFYFNSDAGVVDLVFEGNSFNDNTGAGLSVDQDTGPGNSVSLSVVGNTMEDNTSTGLYIDNRVGAFSAVVSGNSITGNGGNGVYAYCGEGGVLDLLLDGNEISGNSGRGAHFNNDAATFEALVQNNRVAFNLSDAFEFDNADGGVVAYDLGGGALGSLGLNSIFASGSGYDLDNDTADTIMAENNWWGIATVNPARFSGSADYDPYLTSEPQ